MTSGIPQIWFVNPYRLGVIVVHANSTSFQSVAWELIKAGDPWPPKNICGRGLSLLLGPCIVLGGSDIDQLRAFRIIA